MTDDDIPEVDEEWFKNALLRLGRDRPLSYRLVGKTPVPCSDDFAFGSSYGERADAFRKTGDDPWRVAHTEVPGRRSVSTVFLGFDHRYVGDGPPLLFETMIFPGAEMVGRCSTWEEAEAMHEEAVAAATKLRVVK